MHDGRDFRRARPPLLLRRADRPEAPETHLVLLALVGRAAAPFHQMLRGARDAAEVEWRQSQLLGLCLCQQAARFGRRDRHRSCRHVVSPRHGHRVWRAAHPRRRRQALPADLVLLRVAHDGPAGGQTHGHRYLPQRLPASPLRWRVAGREQLAAKAARDEISDPPPDRGLALPLGAWASHLEDGPSAYLEFHGRQDDAIG
mmetsp:Transcript_111692/g.288665  ORF Transcript_111692/g.288665 Transcript_111692/m.288665 type:complete len:201 (+) Transcript_111692:465-1067(+)